MNAHVHSRMVAQRTTGTAPELNVRRLLHRGGLRFRVGLRPEPDLRTTGDIVFTRKKLVVFIDGCFWHGCPTHFVPPKNNAVWWAHKIGANQARDDRNRAALRDRGWTVLSHWEHEAPELVAVEVCAAVRAPS